MTYLDYRHRVEFGMEEYAAIDDYARQRGIAWFASTWDVDSSTSWSSSTGVKRIYEGELAAMKKLRRVQDELVA